MNGGISPSPALGTLVRALCGLSLTMSLSACALFHQNAPVVEAEVQPVEAEPSIPLDDYTGPATPPPSTATPTPAPSPAASEESAAKKPHREPPPRPRARPAAPPPPPPAPPPLFMTRVIPRDEVHGLLDSEVQKRGGKVVGRAIDVVVDPRGAPRDMILNLTGFMGVGDRKLDFPWPLFRFPPGGHGTPILLDVVAAPVSPLPHKPLPGATALRLPLIDATVERPAGGDIGRVVDVLIDRSAEPQALILDLNGLADARHTIAVNWSAVRFAVHGNILHAQLDLNETQLRNAPVYAGDKPIIAISPPPAPSPPPAGVARR